MRRTIGWWTALSCAAALSCGGGSSNHSLDQDYSNNFVGLWNGTGTMSYSGQAAQPQNGAQNIMRTDVNRLALPGFCSESVGATASVTSPSTFAFDVLACPPHAESCGDVTVSVASGTGQVNQGTLSFSVNGVAAGCGQSLPFILSFSGVLVTNATPPVAAVTTSTVQTTAGMAVTLDASPSSDPLGRALSYGWVVSQEPAGGDAALVGATTSTPTFSATVGGTYLAQLTVTALGGPSATATVTITVSAAPWGYPPVVLVAAPTVRTDPGRTVTLDGSRSYDLGGSALRYLWEVTQEPAGGDAVIGSATSAVATFKATIPGTYLVRLTVATSSGGSTALVTVSLVPAEIITTVLPHEVAQAQFSRRLERIVMTDGSASVLFVYDPVSLAETAVPLPLPPQCLSIAPDGLHALVGHNAWVSYVDLANGLVETIPASMNVGDCVLAGNGWAFLFSQGYSGTGESLQIATGAESSQPNYYQGSHGVMATDGLTMYAVTTDQNPSQVYRYDFSGGAAVEKWSSSASAIAPLWFSRVGNLLFTGASTAYRTSSVQAQDLLDDGSLTGMGVIRSLDSSATEVAAIEDANAFYYGPNVPPDTVVEVFSAGSLAPLTPLVLPRWYVNGVSYDTHGRFVFYSTDGTRKYVIVQGDSTSGLLHDTAVLTF
jgi:chitinase